MIFSKRAICLRRVTLADSSRAENVPGNTLLQWLASARIGCALPHDMLANQCRIEATAENWNLPVEAVEEIACYCEAKRDLIGMEADEEKRFVLDNGDSPIAVT